MNTKISTIRFKYTLQCSNDQEYPCDQELHNYAKKFKYDLIFQLCLNDSNMPYSFNYAQMIQICSMVSIMLKWFKDAL